MHASLPDDILTLISEILHAMHIQRAYRAWIACGHARREGWKRLRTHLGRVIVDLEPFSMVRREWRIEAGSWLSIGCDDLGIILKECAHGLWGTRARFAAM